MRVALIDVDGHNFPSLPLMKLSAWHKEDGDTVEWYDPLTAWKNQRNLKCRPDGFRLQRDFRKMVKMSLFGMNTSDTVTTIACIRPMG